MKSLPGRHLFNAETQRTQSATRAKERNSGGAALSRRNEVNAACRIEATCLVKVKRRREHRRKLTLTNFRRKIAAWRKRLLLKMVGLTCRSARTRSSASATGTPATTSKSCEFSAKIIPKIELNGKAFYCNTTYSMKIHIYKKSPLSLALGILMILLLVIQSGIAGSFVTNSPMATAHFDHTANLLTNGNVLVVGGQSVRIVCLTKVEIFEPTNGMWTNCGSLTIGRRNHTGTSLANEKLLVAGGTFASDFINSAELFDPTTGIWTNTGSLKVARENHTATLLLNGDVLVVGGRNPSYLSSAELYDPLSGTWKVTGSMNGERCYFTATRLLNGKVLVVGGNGNYPNYHLSRTELYDPTTGKWTITGTLNIGRDGHTATLLPDGKVLVAGGMSERQFLADSEIYDPEIGVWTVAGSLNGLRYGHTAVLLENGKVLVSGGVKSADNYPSYDNYLTSAEVYDPKTGKWTSVGEMHVKRCHHTMTLLPNGKVLVVGGQSRSDNAGALSSTEIYDPSK